ncbi:MAG: isoprenylcysteine carboxylmethyltransferase family protein [Candidatus Thorarchaeota archaeon]
MEYVLVILGVTIFGLQHSGISALRVKDGIIDRWGKETYANIFNITSIITITIAFLSMNFWDWLYFLTLPELVQPILVLLGVVLFIVGAIIAMAASKVISVSTVADMRTDREPELITDGVYARVRHPLYLATILILMALMMLYPFPTVIIFSIGLCVYTLIGSYFEERKLIRFYGDMYLEYKKTAGFILPKFRR